MKTNRLFKLHSDNDFNEIALDIFRFQAKRNFVYKEFISLLNIDISSITNIYDIPFLPIQVAPDAVLADLLPRRIVCP